MNRRTTTLALLALAAAGPALAHSDKGDDHRPRHGGVFTAGHAADFELVAKPDLIRLYVYDHGKPMDISQASAKLTMLTGKDTQEVMLTPSQGALSATGTFKVGSGTKAMAVVTKGGKTLGTARFRLP